MDLTDLLNAEVAGELAFLSVFHLLGGAALGIGLRGWVNNPTRENLGSHAFFLLWGSGFGCLPLTFGLERGLPMLAAQALILLVAITIPLLWLDRLRELFSIQSVVSISMGGVFLIAGLVAGTFMLRERRWLIAVLFGGLFVLVGGGVFFGGLRNLLRGTPPEDE